MMMMMTMMILINTEPFTEYKLWVKAFTWKNEGESSDTIEVKTDVGGPSPPRILNLSCLALDALFVQWQRPTKFYNTIDYYYVDYRNEEWLDFEELVLPAHRNHYGEDSVNCLLHFSLLNNKIRPVVVSSS